MSVTSNSLSLDCLYSSSRLRSVCSVLTLSVSLSASKLPKCVCHIPLFRAFIVPPASYIYLPLPLLYVSLSFLQPAVVPFPNDSQFLFRALWFTFLWSNAASFYIYVFLLLCSFFHFRQNHFLLSVLTSPCSHKGLLYCKSPYACSTSHGLYCTVGTLVVYLKCCCHMYVRTVLFRLVTVALSVLQLQSERLKYES